MKILKEATGALGTRLRWINEINRIYNKSPEVRPAIKSAFEKVTKNTWDDSATVPENIMRLNTEDLRYIYDEADTYNYVMGNETPLKEKIIDFSFSVKVTEKGYDIYSDGRQATTGSSLHGVKEWITNWIENELN